MVCSFIAMLAINIFAWNFSAISLMLEQTRQLAETEDRSLSSYINLVLKAHLERIARQYGTMEE